MESNIYYVSGILKLKYSKNIILFFTVKYDKV